MSLVYTNNAQSLLASAIDAVVTTVTVSTGEGARFPTISAGNWFPLTLVKADGTGGEIVKVTGRTGDVLTVERGFEGTTATAFSAGDIVSARITKAFLDEFLKNGSSSINVLTGVNFTEGLGTAGSDLYTLTLSGITGYSDNLTVQFLPHSANTGPVQVNLNSLGNVPVVTPDGSPLYANAINGNRIVFMHYDEANARFVIDNAVPVGIGAATTTTLGTVIRGIEENHDVDGDNAKYTTQRNVSRIVKNYVDAQAENVFDPKWSNYGSGTAALNVTADQNMQSGIAHEYTDFSIAAGQTLTLIGGHTTVIRANNSIVIDGDIVVNDRNSDSPIAMVGPRGNNSAAPVGGPPEVAGPQAALMGPQPYGGRLPFGSFELSIKSGTEFQSYHGGHGRGDYTLSGGGPTGAHFLYGCAGLILIAPSITINASATIDVRSRPNTTAFSGLGDAGGGMVILSSESFAVDPNSQWIAGDGTTTANIAHWADPLNYNENGKAANAQLFLINLASGQPAQLF